MDGKEFLQIVSLDQVHSNGDIPFLPYMQIAIQKKYHVSSNDIRSETPFREMNAYVKNIADKILGVYTDAGRDDIFFEAGDCVAHIVAWANEGYRIRVSADTMAAAESLKKALLKKIPATKPEENKVPMSFWTLGKHGPRQRHRKLDVPAWHDIAVNYPEEVGDELVELGDLRPDKSGQLILFHGTPGTGKSYAIRSLIREWRDWCTPKYIVDPEHFFGLSAEYMISVLLSQDDPDELVDEGYESAKDGWKLYIVEDGDEFLTDDAKSRSGQALSRLLNVVDGMIGQGLRVLVLITTNEPLEKIHPAIVRPGRCLANVSFRKFSESEGYAWLKARSGESKPVRGELSLAELYHELGEIESIQPKVAERKIGFGA